MARVWKTAVCIVLIVAMLSLSLSAFADDTEYTNERVDLQLSMAAYYIYLMLQSWGINVQYGQVDGFVQEVKDQIIGWMIDYVAQLPSAYTVTEWIAPWQVEYDYWGNFRGNESMLEDVSDFAVWLKQLLGITDNSSIAIDAITVIDGTYTFYYYDHIYSAIYEDGTYRGDYIALKNTTNSDQLLGYFIAGYQNGNSNDLYLVSVSASAVSATQIIYAIDEIGDEHQVSVGSLTARFWNTDNVNNVLYYWTGMDADQTHGYWLPVGNYYIAETQQQWLTFLKNFSLEQIGNMLVVTANVVLPIDDPDYVDGDSIVIIDGTPQYQVLEWDGTVTVNNLPAVVSTGTITNPGINSFFGFIPALVDYTSDAFSLLVGIIYEMPEEVIIPIYAVFGSICLLGLIKLMREH